MSESVDQGLADLTALEQAGATDLAKLKTDVAALVAAFQTPPPPGTLTAAQQASLDALKAAMSADATTITEIDQSIPPTTPTP